MKTTTHLLGALAVLALGTMAAFGQENDLSTPDAFNGIADPTARSVALFNEMGKVITHPRCMNCHPVTGGPTQGDDFHPHNPPVVRGDADFGAPGMMCSTCHGPANMALVSNGRSIPGDPAWALAPISMGWQGRSLSEICAALKDPEKNGGRDLEAIYEHNAKDHLVGWGWNPGDGRTSAPGTQEIFGELTRAWIETGAACPS